MKNKLLKKLIVIIPDAALRSTAWMSLPLKWDSPFCERTMTRQQFSDCKVQPPPRGCDKGPHYAMISKQLHKTAALSDTLRSRGPQLGPFQYSIIHTFCLFPVLGNVLNQDVNSPKRRCADMTNERCTKRILDIKYIFKLPISKCYRSVLVTLFRTFKILRFVVKMLITQVL